MLEVILERDSSLVLVMKLIYNLLDANGVIENDVFYFNPNSDDEEMPSFWLKKENWQIAWYRDNPDRGASANIESSPVVALHILDQVMESTEYANLGTDKSM